MDIPVLEQLELASHATPKTPLTIDHAHQAMRLHRACALDHCHRKALAFATLIAAGRIVPDSSRKR
ncbi:hypothetical protein [Nocardia sp. NPDC049149]|uniref:hypothetical protein n=1 Tax=Nocardia sp. NPDC049149 TaxID=3364315 RepID=UPI00371B7888